MNDPRLRFYEFRHVVSLADTNLVGNVYFTNHLAWQGRCRELFLRDHAPEMLRELEHGLSLATVSCSCEYFVELVAFDEVIVRMRLVEIIQNRLKLAFDYWRMQSAGEELVARGEQQIACMRCGGGKTLPTPVPQSLREALAHYT